MTAHLIDGEFQSDKYPTTPRGCVPLKPSDPMARDLLAEYARRRRSVDAEFADDLEEALELKGYTGIGSMSDLLRRDMELLRKELERAWDKLAKAEAYALAGSWEEALGILTSRREGASS